MFSKVGKEESMTRKTLFFISKELAKKMEWSPLCQLWPIAKLNMMSIKRSVITAALALLSMIGQEQNVR